MIQINILSIYVGVGNRGSISIYHKLSAAFAITEPRKIIDEAYKYLVKNYQSGDSIFIFGFSRGAALARLFAQKIADDGLVREKTVVAQKIDIELLGVWDTVAAFGGVNLDTNKLPSTSEVKEVGGKIGIFHYALNVVNTFCSDLK